MHLIYPFDTHLIVQRQRKPASEAMQPRQNAPLAIASPLACYSRVTSGDFRKWRLWKAYSQVKTKKLMHSVVFEYMM